MRAFYADWSNHLKTIDFDKLSQEGKVDYILFRTHLEHELRQLDIEARQLAEIQPLLPFAATIIDLEEARRSMEPIDSAKTAVTHINWKLVISQPFRALPDGTRAGWRIVPSPAVPATDDLHRAARKRCSGNQQPR